MATNQKDTDQLDPSGGNVEQIREILFGGHIRAFDERFELVEARLAKETDVLRKAIEKRVLELERVVTEFREEAKDHLDAEVNSRDLALNKVELALGQARADAENQMATIEERFASELKEIRGDIKAVHNELSSALAKAERAQERRADKLSEDKVARRDLANLLKTVAGKLQPEKSSRSK